MTTALAPEGVLPETRTRVAKLTLEPQARGKDGELRLVGYGAVFDSPSQDLGFREILRPGCFRAALSKPTTDVKLYWSHDASRPLARQSAGNLRVTEDAKGLRFEATCVDTSYARDALALVRSGVVRQCSFGFRYSADGSGERWFTRDGEAWVEVFSVGELYEISLVADPAYTSTEVEARAATTKRTGRLKMKPRSAYGPGSPHSWFRDRAMVAHEEAQLTARGSSRDWIGGAPLFGARSDGADQGGIREARERLKTVETRDVAVGDFFAVDGGTPQYVQEVFATAVRAKGVLPGVLRSLPLPDSTGITLETGRLTTGASATVRADGGAVTETNLAGELVEAPLGEVAGMVDVGRILLERAAPGIDAAIAQDLGEAVATALDRQILAGTGSNGELLGLDNVTGIEEVAYTDASPTQQEALAKILETISTVAGNLGRPPTHVLAHTRRVAWLFNMRDGATGLVKPPELPFGAAWVPVPAITTTAGAGTNEDEIWVVAADEIPLFTAPTVVRVFPEVASATGVVRVQAFVHAALMANRRPEAIGRVSGTGLAGVTF